MKQYLPQNISLITEKRLQMAATLLFILTITYSFAKWSYVVLTKSRSHTVGMSNILPNDLKVP